MFFSQSILAILIFWLAYFHLVQAFTFTFGAPTQCDELSLSWSGGTPPFQLLITPVFGTPRNISIPANAFNNGKGVFSALLPFAQGSKFLLTMSDATGFGSGGSTDILTTGASQGGSCNTTDPGVDFSFELNSALQQCRPYAISNYLNAVQPVTITAIVPGGTFIILNPPMGPTDFIWNANVASGTSMLFMMMDSQGRNGGSSDIKTVGITNDATCLNNLSPFSTITSSASSSTNIPSSSSSPSPTETTIASSTPEPAKRTSIAAVAGTVIGALVFLAVAITLGLFFLRRRKDEYGSGGSTFRRHSQRIQSEVDLTYDPGNAPLSTYPHHSSIATSPMPLSSSGNVYNSDPFLDSDSPQQQLSQYQLPSQYQGSSQYQPPSQYSLSSQYQLPSHYRPHSLPSTDVDPFDPYAPSHSSPFPAVEPFTAYSSDPSRDSMSSAQRKAAQAGISTYKPSRFIVHTDVEDELPLPNEDGVVELPPLYSERRGPPGSVPIHDPLTSHGHRPPSPTSSAP